MKGDDAEAIKAKTNALAQASMKLGEAMYKAQQRAEPAREAGAAEASEGRRRRRGVHRSRRRQEEQEVCLIGSEGGRAVAPFWQTRTPVASAARCV